LLAQLVEQGTLNAWVGGSSPSQPTYSNALESLAENLQCIQTFSGVSSKSACISLQIEFHQNAN